MTTAELIKAIKANSLQKLLFNLSDMEEYLEDTDFETIEDLNAKLKELEFGEMVQKSSVCNSDEMNVVIHFKDHDLYLMLSGEYDSYGNYEHDYDCGIKEVKPKTETVTVYE